MELNIIQDYAIQARIASLSKSERDLLEKAATLGSVFWLGALVVLQRIDAEAVGRQLADADRRVHQGGERVERPARRI